jgi:hypothetical protein
MAYRNDKPEVVTKLQLQGRTNSSQPWGIYNTVPLGHEPDENEGKALRRAKAEIARLKANWHDNYDQTIEFRVIEL